MIIKDAILDKTRKYLYVLKRGLNEDNFINFVLLNPSTADEIKDDPTIKACIKFAENLGYDGFWVTNLFAFRATDPDDLKKSTSPVGVLNDQYLKEYAQKAKIVVIAWGNDGDFLGRDKVVIKMLSKIKELHCLGVTTLGRPRHPLYVKRNVKLVRFGTIIGDPEIIGVTPAIQKKMDKIAKLLS